MAVATKPARPAAAATLYHSDFYKWLNHQAAALRRGNLAALDAANLAEEIEDMGRSEKRAVRSQLSRLLAHLLKWYAQPELRRAHRRSQNSWRASISGARYEISQLLQDSPSLKRYMVEMLPGAYVRATKWAIEESGLPQSAFPEKCAWTLQQVMSDSFYPGDGDNDSGSLA